MAPRSAKSKRDSLAHFLRQTLYARERHGFRCDRDPCECRKHQRDQDLDGPLDLRWFGWVRHLVRLESMIAVGCTFGPNDVSWEEWDGLVTLNIERHAMRTRVDEFRRELDKADREVAEQMAAVQKAAGHATTGQSLFAGQKRPRRR